MCKRLDEGMKKKKEITHAKDGNREVGVGHDGIAFHHA